MSTASLARPAPIDDAVVTAMTPYALAGLVSHLLDFGLPAPETIEVRRGHVRLWITQQAAVAWKAHADVDASRHEPKFDHHLHIVDAVLHGSCVKVQLRWITFIDHHDCESCDAGLCACRDVDGPCEGRVEHACRHGQNLCEDCQGQCSACRDDFREGRWS
jgi:hypothetical protein